MGIAGQGPLMHHRCQAGKARRAKAWVHHQGLEFVGLLHPEGLPQRCF